MTNDHRVSALIKAVNYFRMNPLILDTETTGIDEAAELVEIAIVDLSGNILLNSLVKPEKDIPVEASSVHGISGEMVSNAPMWEEIYNEFLPLTRNRNMGGYNIEFDLRIINQSGDIGGFHYFMWEGFQFCVMKLYAEYRGEWNPKFDSYRWCKLPEAASSLGLNWNNSHRALDDAILTKDILQKLVSIGEKELGLNPYAPITRTEFLVWKNGGMIDCYGMDLTGIKFREDDLDMLNFDNSKLDRSVFSNLAIHGRTDFKGCSLDHTEFLKCNIIGTNFENASLVSANFQESSLLGVSFKWANLESANLKFFHNEAVWFDQANLRNANLSNADMGYSLDLVSFKNTNLFGANLSNGNFSWRDFRGANMQNTDITGAIFRNAKLNGVNMSGAKMGKIVLKSGDAREQDGEPITDFKYADLTDAVMPNGKIFHEGWFKEYKTN